MLEEGPTLGVSTEGKPTGAMPVVLNIYYMYRLSKDI